MKNETEGFAIETAGFPPDESSENSNQPAAEEKELTTFKVEIESFSIVSRFARLKRSLRKRAASIL